MPDLCLYDDLPAAAPRAGQLRAGTQPVVAAMGSVRRSDFRRLTACLLGVVLAAGCGDDGVEQRKAYDAAMQVVERERSTLTNMKAERERLYGELLMHDFESRVWSGEFSPHQWLGLDFRGDYATEYRLSRFIYRKAPLGWVGRIDRLLTRSPTLMPWYDRYQGEIYRRRLTDRYARMLNDLRDRIALQNDRVRNAEEYARIVKPAGID